LTRRRQLAHRYVEFIPKELDEGVLYISQRFKTASHLCCCGCGQKAVTPLNPAKWRLIDHGSTISLSPSIGLGTFPCRSHYWIRQSRVDWYPNMTEAQTMRTQRADEFASQVYTGERSVHPTPEFSFSGLFRSCWTKFGAWIRSVWK
jgi:Family of unknown function (DUF6527)